MSLGYVSSLDSLMPPPTPEPKVTHYSAGFLFSPSKTKLLLIRKNRPAWMRGMLNGIGGHIEPGETPHDCMVRECQEETGLIVPEWKHFVTLRFPEAVINFFTAVSVIREAKDMTDERLYATDVSEGSIAPGLAVVPNLRWLIPMALHFDRDKVSSYDMTAAFIQ